MKLPTTYDDDIFHYDRKLTNEEMSSPSTVYSLIYPPIGFFPFYDIGNGDYYGLYWPLGREDSPPLVAFSSHDAFSLIPENSSIESFYDCALARVQSDDDDSAIDLEDYADFVTTATGSPPVKHEIRGVAYNDFDRLLNLDSKSPFYNCAQGDVLLERNDLDGAEQQYRSSLQQLPEYVAAHFGLANLLRRQRRQEEASLHLREALTGPLTFWGGSFWSETALPGKFRNDWNRKALMWLQRTSTLHESIRDDPFVHRISELSFKTGEANNQDIEILHSIIEEYANAGEYTKAVQAWTLIGNMAALETTSFRERYQLTPVRYGNRLAELLALSGNPRRAALVTNMLKAMEKPEGLYL